MCIEASRPTIKSGRLLPLFIRGHPRFAQRDAKKNYAGFLPIGPPTTRSHRRQPGCPSPLYSSHCPSTLLAVLRLHDVHRCPASSASSAVSYVTLFLYFKRLLHPSYSFPCSIAFLLLQPPAARYDKAARHGNYTELNSYHIPTLALPFVIPHPHSGALANHAYQPANLTTGTELYRISFSMQHCQGAILLALGRPSIQYRP